MIVIKRDYIGVIFITFLVIGVLSINSILFSLKSITGFVTKDDCDKRFSSCLDNCKKELAMCNDACIIKPYDLSCNTKCINQNITCTVSCETPYNQCLLK